MWIIPFQAGFNTTPEEDEAWAYYWKHTPEKGVDGKCIICSNLTKHIHRNNYICPKHLTQKEFDEWRLEKMTKTCNGCMTGKILFKLEGTIAIYKNGILIKYLPNEDLSDQYYCEKCSKKLDYLEDL